MDKGIHHITVSISTQDGSQGNQRKAVINLEVSARSLNAAIDKAVGMLKLNYDEPMAGKEE